MTTPNENDPTERTLARLLGLAGPRPEPPDAMRDAVRAATHEAWQRRLRRRRRQRVIGAVALAATLAGLAMFLVPDTFRQQPQGVSLAQADRISGQVDIDNGDGWQPLRPASRVDVGARLRTAAGAGAGLLLEHGYSLRVGENTFFELVAPLELELQRGRIYADSGSHSGNGSLTVRTAGATVHEIGTQFEVQTATAALMIAVREGRLNVTIGDRALDAAAGQSLQISADGTVRRRPVAADDVMWQWAAALAPVFDTDGRSLAAFLEWVARETGRELNFASVATQKAVAETVLHGSIGALDPANALNTVMPTTAFDYELVGAQIVIRSRQRVQQD